MLHRYLRWLVGLVDSDTLPLNVSREMLQAHSSLKTIKKKLVRTLLFLSTATCIRGLMVTSVHLYRLASGDGALLLQVRKALDMIRKIADAQTAAEAEEKDEDGEKKGALAGRGTLPSTLEKSPTALGICEDHVWVHPDQHLMSLANMVQMRRLSRSGRRTRLPTQSCGTSSARR